MKKNLSKSIYLTALATLALALEQQPARAANDIHFGPTASEASTSNPDGTWINMWGPAYASTTFDSTNPPPSGDTAGSVYLQGNWTTNNTGGWDDYNMVSPGTWWGAVTFDGTLYSTVMMDFKYDTNSTMTPSSAAHEQICFETGYKFVTITNLSLGPSSPLVDGQWHHLAFAIPSAISGVGTADGISFYQWNPGGTVGTMNYWVANVVLVAKVVPTPPPTLALPTKPALGLNVYASTEGNSFYDRQEAMLRQSSGISWVGHATQASPVTYSFTIKKYPNSPDCEAYVFMAPNPAAIDSAPDWNETNCVKVFVQGTPTNATLHFQYKVNEPSQQGMYSGASGVVEGGTTNSYTNAPGSWNGVTTPWLESGDLGSVTNNTILGTWSLTFTSDTNVTLTAPSGNTTTCVFPAYNVGVFAETQSPGSYIFLGMQANNANAMNQAVVYANFGFTGTAAPFSENFLTDSALDTVSTWNTSMSGGPQGVVVVPATATDWITWNLPANGFGLQTSSSLTSAISWSDLTAGPIVPLYGRVGQYVSTSELPGGQSTYFRLIKRVMSQLQVLLPGESNAPNTLTGKTGTPDTFSASTNNLVTVTVNAVDSTFHIIPGVSDNVSITTSAGAGAIDPNAAALANGTGQFTIQFNAAGSWTVTGTDNTNTNIPPATSSSLEVDN